MRFKLDENLPVELVTDLRDMGHHADTVAGEGLRGAADPAVVNAAFAADRIFVYTRQGYRQSPALPHTPTCGRSLVSTRHHGTRRRRRVCARSATQAARTGSRRPAHGRGTVRYPVPIVVAGDSARTPSTPAFRRAPILTPPCPPLHPFLSASSTRAGVIGNCRSLTPAAS